MNSRIQAVIKEHGKLVVDVLNLAETDSLYDAGMTSHSAVNVMLGLENEFDVEFPDRMLRRDVFESLGAMRRAIEELIQERQAA